MSKLLGISFFILIMFICMQFQFHSAITEKYMKPVQEYWYRLSPELINTGIPLLNMTTRLLRDMEQKLMQAEHIKSMYKDNPMFDLGCIVSDLQDHFKHMLEIYKVFADMPSFEEQKFYVLDILNGYHSIQGAYHQLRLKKDLYDEIIKSYLEKIEKEKEIKHSFGGPPGMSLKELKEKIKKYQQDDRTNTQFGRRYATKLGFPEPSTTYSTPKRRWSYKPKWFSEDERLLDY